MGLEVGSFISDLVITNPLSTDLRREGDDHLRLIKTVLKATFPNANAAINPSPAEFNHLVGVTSAIQTQLDGKAASSHNHSAADIDSGTLPVARGGTGVTTSTGTGSTVRSAGPTFTGTANFATIVASGDITANSDLRLKRDIKKIENAVGKLKAISGYTFFMKGIEERRAGVIAQELQHVLPEVVLKNNDEYLSVNYGTLSALLIEAIKEVEHRLAAVEAAVFANG